MSDGMSAPEFLRPDRLAEIRACAHRLVSLGVSVIRIADALAAENAELRARLAATLPPA